MMARIAALSGAGNLSHAVTTWDKSWLDGTEICVSLCVSLCGFPLFSWVKCGVRIPLSPPVWFWKKFALTRKDGGQFHDSGTQLDWSSFPSTVLSFMIAAKPWRLHSKFS